jgi:uncharacterized protein (TIGR03067 family)
VKKVLVGLFAVLLVGVATAGDDAKKALKQLEGTWSVVSVVERGKKVPADNLAEVQFVIAGDKLTMKKGDKSEDGTIKLDPTQKPAHIDVTHGEKTKMGIYSVTKDELKICVGDTERPKEFDSPAGSKIVLIVLKREKK